MMFDDMEPMFEESLFKVCDWSDFYLDAEEAILHDAPKVQGNGILTSCFLDADHAGCGHEMFTYGSHLICEQGPIMWYLKHQNTVQTSTFGSEFCAMKTAMDMIEGLL
jgi:hypothetical protein